MPQLSPCPRAASLPPLLLLCLSLLAGILLPQFAQARRGRVARLCPRRLTIDLLERKGNSAGEPALQVATSTPSWGWDFPVATLGVGCCVWFSTSPRLLREGLADVWDSGRLEGTGSTGVPWQGAPLQPSARYWWTVRTWSASAGTAHGERRSPYAPAMEFATAATLDSCFSHYPLVKTRQKPLRVTRVAGNAQVYDFGRDAFAQLTLRVHTSQEGDSITLCLGEAMRGGRVDRKPQGLVRHASYTIPLRRGTHTYPLRLRPDPRNTAPHANESGVEPILMPDSVGEVYPFRYVEVEGTARVQAVWREAVHEPFSDQESYFHCSDTVLNQVWDLCKYSIKATSFAGIYVDGDRERIPYEADALVNQLSHYATDREYTMARRSIAHLIGHPTWPTEWVLLTPRMAWLDYLYTGDSQLLARYYADLAAKALPTLRDSRGLISTRTGLVTDSVLRSVHFAGRALRDIVDWPQGGAAGIEKEAAGEADGHEMRDINTVVNAYHYDALSCMSLIAGALGHKADSLRYAGMAAETARSLNRLLWDEQRGAYTDGEGSQHCSQHSSMFALAFGLVPPEREPRVASHVQSRGMACSVYGAQFLLDALYRAGRDTAACRLMAGTGRRSWYNMLRMGSTITTEAWDCVYKGNLDWNHAWGAAAANLIARGLMGISPLKPGFAQIDLRPQPGTLSYARIRQPSPRGSIGLELRRRQDGRYDLRVTVPANSTARLTLPTTGRVLTLSPGTHRISE